MTTKIEMEFTSHEGIVQSGRAIIEGMLGGRHNTLRLGPAQGETEPAFVAHVLGQLAHLRGEPVKKADRHITGRAIDTDEQLLNGVRERLADALNTTDRKWCDYSIRLGRDVRTGAWCIWLGAMHSESSALIPDQTLDQGTYAELNARLPLWLYELERQLGHIPTEEEAGR